MDDEYFWSRILLREDVFFHPEAMKLRSTMERSFTKPEKARSLDALIKSIQSVEFVTRSGLYIRKGWTVDIDLGRLDRVVERTTKGLFFQLRRVRLPNTHTAKSLSESGFAHLSNEERANIQTTLRGLFAGTHTTTIGNGVFSYKVFFTDQDPNTSAWLMTFYDKVSFFSLTAPDASLNASLSEMPRQNEMQD